MVLKTEQVRLLHNEESLLDVATEYTQANTGSWDTLHDYGGVTAPKTGLLIFNFETKASGIRRFRLKVGGSLYAFAQAPGLGEYIEYSCVCYVEAGSYNILLESYSSSGTQYVRNFQCGFVLLSDMKGNKLQTYSAALSSTVLVRKTPLGNLKKTMLCVNVYAYTSGGQTNFEDVGDSETNGVSISVDGTQVDWTTKVQDASSLEAAYANLYLPVTADEEHEVTISKDNGSTVVHINIVSCPWLLGSVDHEPVTIDFLQNSTVYVVCEPLDANPTKTVKVGKARAVSFGDATDYYDSDTDSGSEGILSYSYTFESVKISYTSLLFTGLGACISNIGVDVS